METKCWVLIFEDEYRYVVYTDHEAACNAVKDYYLDHIAEWIQGVDGDIVKKDLINDMDNLHYALPYIEDTVYMYEGVLAK